MSVSAMALELLEQAPWRSDADIARELGCTRAMVNLVRHKHGIVKTADPGKMAGEVRAIAQELNLRLARAQNCMVCGAIVIRSRSGVTCSKQCAWLRSSGIRHHLEGSGSRPYPGSKTSIALAAVAALRHTNGFTMDERFEKKPPVRTTEETS